MTTQRQEYIARIHQVLDDKSHSPKSLHIIQDFLPDCCMDKQISIFVSNRLKEETLNESELKTFITIFEAQVNEESFTKMTKN